MADAFRFVVGLQALRLKSEYLANGLFDVAQRTMRLLCGSSLLEHLRPWQGYGFAILRWWPANGTTRRKVPRG
jgi:hypothetical protein